MPPPEIGPSTRTGLRGRKAGPTRWTGGGSGATVQHAINEALAELPEGCVDALYFDSYAANDRLELLTDQQLQTLLKTKPDGLAKVLSLPYPPAPGLWDALFG